MVLDINLADARWHMSQKQGDLIHTTDIRSFENSREWFRLVYHSELQAGTQPDDGSDSPFWQGDMVSQAFSASGQTDRPKDSTSSSNCWA